MCVFFKKKFVSTPTLAPAAAASGGAEAAAARRRRRTWTGAAAAEERLVLPSILSLARAKTDRNRSQKGLGDWWEGGAGA